MKEIKGTTQTIPSATKHEEKKLPKGTERFGAVIKAYLDKRAGEDELFKTKYEAVNRPIEDIVAYILSEVQRSGVCGWTDDEVFSLAVHAAEEAELKIPDMKHCQVVVNHHIELTEEEKAEQRASALKRFQEEELAKVRARNAKPKAVKPQTQSTTIPSLFDDF
ncbi:MAG: PcfK-like family protein [Muribaculaceae bacterium]|nr:PcfK-like family protein [Muribaculaceae bacterium]